MGSTGSAEDFVTDPEEKRTLPLRTRIGVTNISSELAVAVGHG